MEDLTKFTDYELLDRIIDADVSVAEKAFAIFHARHLGFMASVARKFAYKKFPRESEEVANDILGDAIEKVIRNLKAFRKHHGLSPNDQSKHLRTWLYRIIERSFLDRIREGNDVIDYEELSVAVGSDPAAVGTVWPTLSKLNKKRIEEIQTAAMELSDKDQFILRAFLRYGRIEESGNWVLEQEAMESLCKKLNVRPNSINQAKKRIIEKLRIIIQKRQS